MELTDLIAMLGGKDTPTLVVLGILIWRLEARLARIEKQFDMFGERLLPQVKKQ